MNYPRTPQVKRKASDDQATPRSEPKRNVIDARKKIEIIFKHNNGKSTTELAYEYNLAASTISMIIKAFSMPSQCRSSRIS